VAPPAADLGETMASAWTAFERVWEERLASFGSQLDAVAGFISFVAEKLERIENRVEEVVAKKLLESEARLAGWVDRVVERRVGLPGNPGEPPAATALAELRRIEALTAKIEGVLDLLDQRHLPAVRAEGPSPRERDAEPA
jgi:hypothetical protein